MHNNDGESQLINAGSGLEDFGGAARFTTVVRKARLEAKLASGFRHRKSECQMGVLTLSSGDNFLAGPEFSASLDKGVPFYDSILISLIGYDALAMGNHEFDFGPDVLEEFIAGIGGSARFLSANLDFSQEPGLQAFVEDNRIAKSTIIREYGEYIGVVGATTDKLSFISSPRGVIVNEVAPAVQAEIDRLTRKGVNKIILISHLQSVDEDLALLKELYGVDIAIAGGGDELLANEGDLLVPGDELDPARPYPLEGKDKDGNFVPVVTTAGNYKYLGRLVVSFNERGEIVEVDDKLSGPIRVAGGDNPDAVIPAPLVQRLVVEPVEIALADLAATVVGTSEVALDGVRGDVRTRETNLGNLIADSQLWQATQLADSFEAMMPHVAIQNGGGIRNDDMRGPGDITELDTFDIVPFGNFVCILPAIAPQQFKEILENAVSRVEFTDGRFAQTAGFRLTYDPMGTPQTLDENGNVTQAGQRIKSVVLDDGTVIVENGSVTAEENFTISIATIDFLARGGDQYPYRGASFINLSVSYQQALRNYIQNGLNGSITAAEYPEGGEGRISTLQP